MSAPHKSKQDAAQEEEGGGGEEGQEAAQDDAHPPVYEKLDQFTVNLADQESYLQTEIQLLVADAKVQEKIKARMPEVRDAMIRLLSSKTAEELNQPDGKDKLAAEIQQQLNHLLGIKKPSKGVKKVLFGAFIIQ
jgi:flagellar FliL protein